ncbi:probable cyclic nucleotide-gated ion channel 20, chloroplastic isoform X2 [Rhodamnia argentea]|uniref:Probable cyclic nucleotide-gated ion channel 20, chloroplastic isoform X2 n=1 Tax=Rhodamnia argentea TaxID=178133 RepID=A0ABM3HNZ4_9MYRT|nr:probable cyclic nucleotide-gated ion channel 20, chloroplastic isoform X2 [Rhodamnia argentea]
MVDNERDEVPMLLEMQHQLSDDPNSSRLQSFVSRTRSASISIPASSMEPHENIPNLVGYTGPLRSEKRTPFSQMSGPLYVSHGPERTFRRNHGLPGSKAVESQYMQEKFPSFGIKDRLDSTDDHYAVKNEHLLRSGQLGMCDDPYCTTCPSYYNKRAQHTSFKSSSIFDPKFHNALYGDAKGWARRFLSYVNAHIPGVMNPHAQVVQRWNKFFVISCLLAVFIDPLFFFLLSVQKDNMCIILNWHMTTTIVAFRSMTDLIYLLHILLQFRLAYVAPETRVVGAGDLVDHPKRIALNYLRGYFFIDLFVAFPLPQILVLIVLPTFKGSSAANYAKNLLRAGVLVQYIPRLYRVLPFLAAGHVVGSCWYLLGLQRVNQCLRAACKPDLCNFMDCGHGDKIAEFKENKTLWNSWKKNPNATACFNTSGGFKYGIYQSGVELTLQESVVTRYVFSLFWGFQQISTLAGNQTPSYFVPEVLFTMGIIGLGLLLFALLIGNMQNFLQALGRRRLEMSLRRRDVEQWMSHRRLPEQLRRRVRQAERYNWAATRGVNEEMLLENFSEDLQRDIRRHLFKFVKRVRIFAVMEDHITDAICEKLRQKTYIKGSKILHPGVLVEKLIFIVRGKIESGGEDGVTSLCEGDICGEELLAWCLESSSICKDGRKIRPPGNRLLSNRTVTCVTNVEAFALRAEDLEEVTRLFARFLRKPKVQGAIRYVSPYWRGLAATRIQVAWRYRKKRLSRADTSQSEHPSH